MVGEMKPPMTCEAKIETRTTAPTDKLMKAMYWTSIVALSLAAPTQGQPTAYTLVSRGPHHKVWARATATTNHLGAVHYRTNSYTELQTGMSVLDPDTGQWRDSSPDFEITADGYAVAAHCQHQVIVAPSLIAPDGVVLKQIAR